MRERMAAVFGRVHAADGMAVHCIDLDGFKAINDAHGHQVGDRLLKMVSARLLECVRAADVVARMGGDEFAIVQMGVDCEAAAEVLAGRIIDQIAQPYVIEGCEVVVGASVGVAISPRQGRDTEQLLKNADMALYCVKANGRGTYAFFDPSMDAKVQQRRALEADLRAALGKGEFELHYQPIVALDTGAVLAFEALMRWRHPVRGLVSPADFVPLAEEVGLIVPMGEWVIETACREAASWSAPYRVAVNLSPIQFRSARLLETVEASLRYAGLDPSRLELEITESTMLQDSPATLAALHHLHGLGISIGMDDFGTGYSSLSYLRSFPFDKIKIDKAFIRDIHDSADAGAIVEAVVTLARSLNMVTLAEGVETAAQCEAVRRAGCQQAQGFLFSPPVPSSEIAATLARLAPPEQKVA
jgi:diguanylate cyclase (GGDEF)-like protein